MGALVLDTSALPSFFDALVLWRGVWHTCEIKDGSKPPSRRKLTADQIKLHARVLGHGGRVYVLKDENDCLAMLGARRSA